MLHVVLVEPEIPANTGNIARTCAATGSVLHLIRPLGFDISDKAVKRAGLDYWHLVDVRDYENLDDFFSKGGLEINRKETGSMKRPMHSPCIKGIRTQNTTKETSSHTFSETATFDGWAK